MSELWSSVRMTALRTPLRSSRRSLMLSGALLGTLGLAGCDPATLSGHGEPEDLPPPTLSMEQLLNRTSTIPNHDVVSSLAPIAPVGGRPFAALAGVRRGYEEGMQVVRPDNFEEGPVPIDPLTIATAVDDSAMRARVLTSRPSDGRWCSTMLTSQDLVTWDETALAEEVDLPVEIAGHGMFASSQDGSRIGLWELADDGAVSPLAPLEVPEGQRWSIRGLARADSMIVLLLEASDLRSDQIPASSRTLLSTDGGKSWSDPAPVVKDGSDQDVQSLTRHGQQFVLLGGTRVQPEWSEKRSYWRPTSWISDGGKDFREVPIPLPRWGLDDWTWGEKGAVDAETEIDMEDLDWHAPVVLHDGGALHLPVYYQDILWIATREADGSWSISERMPQLEEVIDAVVAMPEAAVVVFPTRLTGATPERGSYGSIVGWEQEVSSGLPLAPSRRLVTDSGLCGTPLSLLLQQSTRELVTDEEDSSTEIITHHRAWSFMVDGDEIATVEGVPEEAWQRESLALRALEPGRVLLLGVEKDDGGVRRLRAHVSVDGDWVEASLDVERPDDIWDLTTIDGAHHLCISVRQGEDGHDLAPLVLTSTDGVEWAELVGPEAVSLPDEGAESGARILHVEKIGEALVGVGSTVGADDYFRAASFVLEGEQWTALPLEGAGLGSTIVSLDPVGGEHTVGVWTVGLMDEGKIDAHGAVTVAGTPTEDSWGRIIDLGEGLLVAPGELLSSRSEKGHGSCIWASRDGGASWGATTIPGAEGHAGTVHLLVDGDDLIAVTAPGGAVVVHRIVDPRAQLSAA